MSERRPSLLALAGVVQAAALVHAVANGRPIDVGAQQAVLAAITTHRAERIDDIVPNPRDLQLGLGVLRDALAGAAVTPEVVRYTLQLMELTRRLRKSPDTIRRLRQLLDGVLEPDPALLADVYQQTISTLGKRIQVTGEPTRLQDTSVANGIRALLLAGVRFAWLWHQLGGRRWHLALRRKALLGNLQELLKAI